MNRLTSFFVILLAIALFYAVTSPQYEKAKALQATFSQYKNVADNVSQISDVRDKLLSEYNAVPKDQVDRIDKALPGSADTVDLALALDGIASHYGIAIKDIQVTNSASQASAPAASLPQSGQAYGKATVTFDFVSSYDTFMRFLGDIEKSLRIMDVRNASFKVDDSGLYDHQVTVDTYWLK